MKRKHALLGAVVVICGCVIQLPGTFPDQEAICQENTALEQQRRASAAYFPQPVIERILVNGLEQWSQLNPQPIQVEPGDEITLEGTGLGAGTHIDFSKIVIGDVRILETDLVMFKQQLAVLDEVNFETSEVFSQWEKNILDWQQTAVQFRVPDHAVSGDLILQIQKRVGANESLLNPGRPHLVLNALTKRVIDAKFQHECDVVSQLSDPKATTPIAVTVNNPYYDQLVAKGRQAFWSWDYNIGLTHSFRDLNWTAIMNGKATDPITGEIADPVKLFGAVPTVRGEVPDDAIDDVYFDSYPMKTPIPGLLATGQQKYKGNTKDSGYVGYRYAEAVNPFSGAGSWIGFNCASCHGYRVSYEAAPGEQINKVIAGMPNPGWTMKWASLTTPNKKFEGIYADEPGPVWDPGTKPIAKDMLLYVMPPGTGEHNIIRMNGEGSSTDNDYQFSPIKIPSVTKFLPIRRPLSHTESYVGFEGSYIHAEEPDGAFGAMGKEWLEALTAYMSTLDDDDDDLRNVGLYRWLKHYGKLAAQTNGNPGEGEFVSQGWQSFSGVQAAVNRGKATFDRNCVSCHQDATDTHTNEQMIRLDQVGRFFAPTIYQKETQSTRVTFLRNLYWSQHSGLLTDSHVRNLEDLVDPDRCTPGSDLYNQYYTLHAPARPDLGGPDHPQIYPDLNRRGDVFRVPKSSEGTKRGRQRNRFIERHKYFVEVPWDPDFYYWDYQKMRTEWGPGEIGSANPVVLPKTPHPWCADSAAEVDDLVQYLLTL